MIERIYTPKLTPVASTMTVQFKIAAIMLIVNKYKSISLMKIQLCLWGLQQKDNLQEILDWKNKNQISHAGWIDNEAVTEIVMQCVANKLLKLSFKNKQVKVELDREANRFLFDIQTLDITNDINADLKRLGIVTDVLLKNIQFNF